jgi:hypothetical protein
MRNRMQNQKINCDLLPDHIEYLAFGEWVNMDTIHTR